MMTIYKLLSPFKPKEVFNPIRGIHCSALLINASFKQVWDGSYEFFIDEALVYPLDW